MIPSSKKRHYLSGADWIINALDYILKKETCSGNMSQVVLVLDNGPDAFLLQQGLQEFAMEFPVLHGSVSRDFINLAPYWKIPGECRDGIHLNVSDMDNVSSVDDVIPALEENVNRLFQGENEHLAFHLVRMGNGKSFLSMTFDHRLLDGRGAELFLDLFRAYLSGEKKSGIAEGFHFNAPARLSNWSDKFLAGRNVNRKIAALSGSAPAALPLPASGDKGFRFKLVSFGPGDTEVIYDTAYKKAGYLMEMPYLLSCVIRAVHALFRARGLQPGSYLIPVSVDMRQGGDVKQELFFNHVSYLFFQVDAKDADDLTAMIADIKAQMYDQVRAGLPGDIQEACLLMRIAPLPLLKRVFSIPFDGKIASFCFSHVGKSSYISSEFMGTEISNIFHMPRVPVPPGLGFFFNNFKGRLNLVISCLDGLLSGGEAVMLEDMIREQLGECGK